jgi:hypothetical protein
MGGWKECSPSTVPEFSAVAYLYARELHQKLNVPVGVIDCTWGGTPAEAWTSSESLKQVMGYQKKVGKLEALGFDRDKIMAEYGKEQASWKAEISKIDKGYQNGKACWIGENVDDNDWQQMELPGYWEGKGLPNFDGVVWFRKQIEVPADWAGKDLQLNPGIIDDEDIVYWNGEQIASGAGYNVQRHYTVPARLVKAGRNTLAIKVSDFLFVVLYFSPSRYRHLHVGLSGAEPDFACHDIFQYGLFPVGQCDAVRTSGCRSGDSNPPVSLCVGFRFIMLIVPACFDANLLVRFGFSEQSHGSLLLDNHVVREKGR